MRRKKPLSVVLLIVIAVVVWWLENRKTPSKENEPAPRTTDRSARRPNPPSSGTTRTAGGAIEKAFREKRSKVWVEDEGEIVYLLPDDRVGDKHQLFLVELASGHTIKISHNVDLAPKVPVRKGDPIRFRGRFEWNERGGVVHWTHHDPRGRKKGGWLELRGQKYK